MNKKSLASHGINVVKGGIAGRKPSFYPAFIFHGEKVGLLHEPVKKRKSEQRLAQKRKKKKIYGK